MLCPPELVFCPVWSILTTRLLVTALSMILPQVITNLLVSPGHKLSMLALAMAFFLSGCASQHLNTTKPPPLLNAGPAVEISDVDLLAVTPKMEQFLTQYVLEYNDTDLKRQLLSIAITDRAMLGFYYNIERTLTAEDAFDTRSGNCIAFANLFIALARKAGLKARYHEVLIAPEWDSQDGTFIVSKHINVVVDSPRGLWEVDISGREIKVNAKRRIMGDHEAVAMYFNNLGVEALFNDDLATAHAYMVKAIAVAPAISDSWSNLGVILGRNGQYQDAELAYRTALRISPTELTAMGNLYDLYVLEENRQAADDLEKRVERYRRGNPYYLLLLSDEAIEQREYKESMVLLTSAIEKKGDEHRLHFAMAKTQFLAGERDAAQTSLSRARELAPDDLRDSYNKPLHELVQTGQSGVLN